VIKLVLWDIINAKEPTARDSIPQSLARLEKNVGAQVKAEDAEGHGNDPEADTPECGDCR